MNRTQLHSLLNIHLLLLFCSFSITTHADETIRLQLKWRHQFQFAGYYAAKKMGYYREVGLDVQLLDARPGVDSIKEVLQGRAEYGVGNSGIILSRAAGEPLVVLAVILQHSPFVLLTQQNGDIADVQDLTQKKLMLEPLADDIFAYLNHEKVPLDTLVLVKHEHTIDAFVQGRVDAMDAYTTDEPYQLDKLGIKYNLFSPRSAGIDFYGDNLFTTENEIRQHPERVRKFRAASLRGWHYAMKHKDEIIDLILEHYHPTRDRAALIFEANALRDLMHPELIDIGYMLPGRWRHIAETYASLGMLPKNFSLKGFLYDDNPEQDYTWFYLAAVITLIVFFIVLLVTLHFSKLNKQLTQLLHIKTRFANIGESVNNISHQWKQPLNELGIQLMLIEQLIASALCSDNTKTNIRGYMEKMHDILEFMANTVDAFGHLLNTKYSKTTVFSPKTVIDEVLYLISDTLNGHAITISHHAQDAALIKGNSTEFAHVILSILNNAKDIFIERHRDMAEIKIASYCNAGFCSIEITDNAGGIRVERIDNIFELGFSDKESADSGIGLYIVRQIIVNNFHGNISAQNTDDGTCFTITLPCFVD